MSKRRRSPRPSAKPNKPAKPAKVRDVFVPRPFDGLASEPEWVALRELVPAATAPLALAPEYADKYPDRTVVLATVLPMAWPAMTRPDGRVLIGLQRQFQSGDVSRDLAVALLRALETEPGAPVSVPALPEPGPRLQAVLDDKALDITLHTGFEFWLADSDDSDPAVQESMERANSSIYPTERLAAAPAAYWCKVGERAHVRWVLPDGEDRTLDALARLGAGGALTLGDGTKFAGMFRAHGLLVPVWDLPVEAPAADWEEPIAAFADRYAAALAAGTPLTSDDRRARHGLLGRQLTLR